MKIAEARIIAGNPAAYPERLRLARLKLIGCTLRAFPSGQRQREAQQLIRQIEAMPKTLWGLDGLR